MSIINYISILNYKKGILLRKQFNYSKAGSLFDHNISVVHRLIEQLATLPLLVPLSDNFCQIFS